MLFVLSMLLIAGAVVGSVALVIQTVAVAIQVRRRAPSPSSYPSISVLKPLCGVDDRLEENLACFANLDYPQYEVVLGVKDTQDPAYPVALRATHKWPNIMRVVLQRGEPGYNPKVNQLITLEAEARYDILVVSDSNTQVDPDYLQGIAQAFENPEVACVTHPVVGIGEERMGSRMDNLHLTTCVAAGQISAKLVAGKDLVIGKSMALRRTDLQALGGFLAMRNYLAEDYVVGKWVTEKLHKRVVVAHGRVLNVSQQKSIRSFYDRYARWAVVQRTAVSLITNLGQAMMNPIPVTLLAALAYPSMWTGAALAIATVTRLVADLTVSYLLRGVRVKAADVAAVFLKDFLLFYTWTLALFRHTVIWRGNKLRVMSGSRLVPLTSGEPFGDDEDSEPATADAA